MVVVQAEHNFGLQNCVVVIRREEVDYFSASEEIEKVIVSIVMPSRNTIASVVP